MNSLTFGLCNRLALIISCLVSHLHYYLSFPLVCLLCVSLSRSGYSFIVFFFHFPSTSFTDLSVVLSPSLILCFDLHIAHGHHHVNSYIYHRSSTTLLASYHHACHLVRFRVNVINDNSSMTMD